MSRGHLPGAGLAPRRSHARRPGFALLIGVVLVGAQASLLGPAPAFADTIEVTSLSERAPDPTSVIFSARVRAPAGVKSARLVFRVLNPDGDIGGTGDSAVAPGAESDVSYTLTTNGNERYIPVGSTFVYHWEIEDQSGSKASSAEKEFVFLDGRYQWRVRTEGTNPPITVYWYGANESRANTALEATRASLRVTGELLQTTVPYPIKVVVWASEADGEAAQRSRGRSFDQTVLTGGSRVAPDLILVFVPDVDIVRHEVAHIVTHVAGDGPFGGLPSWIDEGTAVWAQGSPGSGYTSAVDLAVRANQTLNLRSLQSNTNRPEEVNLFYGQAYSTVDYLIKTYGPEKYAELFRVFRAGITMDNAMQQVYGFDQNGLYNLWRASKGLPPATFATAVAGGVPAVEATRPPLGFPTSVSGGASQPSPGGAAATPEAGSGAEPVASGGGVPATGLAVLGGTLVVALALIGGALALMRRRPSTAG